MADVTCSRCGERCIDYPQRDEELACIYCVENDVGHLRRDVDYLRGIGRAYQETAVARQERIDELEAEVERLRALKAETLCR